MWSNEVRPFATPHSEKCMKKRGFEVDHYVSSELMSSGHLCATTSEFANVTSWCSVHRALRPA